MVSPDGHFLNVSHLGSGLESDLSEGSVVIKSGHGSEVFSWETWGICLADKAVSVCWVSNNNSLGITRTVVINSLSNIDKDLSIVLEEISSLHSWSSWLSTNKEVVVYILEGS